MHKAPYDNQNRAIVDRADPVTPLVYFNIVRLSAGERFVTTVEGYETCVVPATGTIDVQIGDWSADGVGGRGEDVWDGEPNAVYVPVGAAAEMTAVTDCEVFIAGAAFDEVYAPFVVRAGDIDPVQYGSDDTKTHRKIKHLLGQNPPGKVGRLLVSELYTVGAGGWSGFPPHKHDTDRLPDESHHDEVYNFRFRPGHGFGMQLLQREDGEVGEAYHIVDGSTLQIDKGYHPCVAAPGYEMYYFTILAGASQRSLVQFFQPTHAYQVETIPGIKDMIAKFK
ncbi:MAG: 5-deoxyglucuronate isomerase [Rhodospirillaceae bacterium TMED140]|nr:5-deoxyglucuronate isomerase [Rhodospirillaceae bacterium]OUX71068.1 MAG: 5-deoxyglucuronate isomerase [Rhodospirillaceae bacterium TMED140]